MGTCPACTNLVSGLVEFIFGWGDPKSKAWRDYAAWFKRQKKGSLPAWTRFIKYCPRSQQLWREFEPEIDPSLRDRYPKECYRCDIRNFFQDQIQRSSDLDKKFFDGFAQMGADPLPCIELFKSKAGLKTWDAVIRTLGNIGRNTMRLGFKYDRKTMGSLKSEFWRTTERLEYGPILIATIREKPIGGIGQYQTAIRILQSCAFLKNIEEESSFSAWIDKKGLLQRVENAQWYDGNSEAVRNWRGDWNKSPTEPWKVPDCAHHLKGKGLGPDTFEYIIRDAPYPGCLNLFKVDSTNQSFVKGTSLANHVRDVKTSSKIGRKEYWEALYFSGALTKFPPAVINMAIYLAVSQQEGIECYWEDGNGKLIAYKYLPAQLMALNSAACTGRQQV